MWGDANSGFHDFRRTVKGRLICEPVVLCRPDSRQYKFKSSAPPCASRMFLRKKYRIGSNAPGIFYLETLPLILTVGIGTLRKRTISAHICTSVRSEATPSMYIPITGWLDFPPSIPHVARQLVQEHQATTPPTTMTIAATTTTTTTTSF